MMGRGAGRAGPHPCPSSLQGYLAHKEPFLMSEVPLRGLHCSPGARI